MNVWIEITRTLSAIVAGAAGGFGYSVWLKRELDERDRRSKGTYMSEAPRLTATQRFVKHWKSIVLLIVAGCVMTSAVLEISSNSKAERADETSTKVLTAYKLQNRCLFDIVNQMADALDARTADATVYRKADEKQDDVVVELFRAQTEPVVEQQKIAQRYLAATLAKKAALKQIEQGIKEKSYPNPPREACADSDVE